MQRRFVIRANDEGRVQRGDDGGEQLRLCGAEATRVPAELERLGEVHRRSQCGDRPFEYEGIAGYYALRARTFEIPRRISLLVANDGTRDPRAPWPLPPKRTVSTYALDEGGKRRWGTEVTGFGGTGQGSVSHVYARQVTGSSSRDLTRR